MTFSRLLTGMGLFISHLILTGCQPASQQNPIVPRPKPTPAIVPVEVVNADSSDESGPLQLNAPDWDINTNLFIEENYPLTDNSYAFTLNKGYYMARIQGREGIYDSRINGRYMCINSHNDCDSTRSKAASLWDRVGQVGANRQVVWSFTDQQQKQGYRFVMNSLPKLVRVLAAPDTIRQNSDNIIRLESVDSRDSLVVELMFLQPDELTRKRVIPFLNNSKTSLVVKAVNNEIRIPSAYLKPLLTYFKHDLVREKIYLNVASIRQVVKRVGTKKVRLTYQVSNWQPTQIR